jgi:hypothetical protein
MEARTRTIVIIASLSLMAIAVAGVLFQKKRRADQIRQSRRRKKVGSVNIGGELVPHARPIVPLADLALPLPSTHL